MWTGEAAVSFTDDFLYDFHKDVQQRAQELVCHKNPKGFIETTVGEMESVFLGRGPIVSLLICETLELHDPASGCALLQLLFDDNMYRDLATIGMGIFLIRKPEHILYFSKNTNNFSKSALTELFYKQDPSNYPALGTLCNAFGYDNDDKTRLLFGAALHCLQEEKEFTRRAERIFRPSPKDIVWGVYVGSVGCDRKYGWAAAERLIDIVDPKGERPSEEILDYIQLNIRPSQKLGAWLLRQKMILHIEGSAPEESKEGTTRKM